MAERLNLCVPVRNALISAGYSSVRVTNAVNASLGELTRTNKEEKLSDGKANIKKDTYKVSGSAPFQLTGRLNTPLLFDSWHSAIAKANKVAEFESVSIPQVFAEWLVKMKEPVTETVTEPVAETVTQS